MFIAVLVYSFRFISFGFEKYNKSLKEIFSVAQKAVQIALVQFVALFGELKKESSEWPTFGNRHEQLDKAAAFVQETPGAKFLTIWQVFNVGLNQIAFCAMR